MEDDKKDILVLYYDHGCPMNSPDMVNLCEVSETLFWDKKCTSQTPEEEKLNVTIARKHFAQFSITNTSRIRRVTYHIECSDPSRYEFPNLDQYGILDRLESLNIEVQTREDPIGFPEIRQDSFLVRVAPIVMWYNGNFILDYSDRTKFHPLAEIQGLHDFWSLMGTPVLSYFECHHVRQMLPCTIELIQESPLPMPEQNKFLKFIGDFVMKLAFWRKVGNIIS